MDETPNPFPIFNELGLNADEYVFAGRLQGRLLALAHFELQTLPKGIRGLAVVAGAAALLGHLETYAPTCERPQDENGKTIGPGETPPPDWDGTQW